MAIVNTFLCNCGRTIGRPINKAPADDAPPQYAGVPWHARPEDAPITGIKCGSCSTNWKFVKPKVHKQYADVSKCCVAWKCEC